MFEGRQRELAIGKYPAMSLADARAKRAELREAKDRGLDPKSRSGRSDRPEQDGHVPPGHGHLRRPHARPVDDRPSEGVAAVRGSDRRFADGQGDRQFDAGRRAERDQAGLGNHQRDRAAGAGTYRPGDRTRHCRRSRSVQRRQSLYQRLTAPAARVRCREAETGDAVAGSARLLCRVAAAPGGRGARARNAVAHLLPQNQRGHPRRRGARSTATGGTCPPST